MVDRVGERFGNYTLTRLLGKGGFAEVYLGEHVHLNSLVAVKLLRTQLASQEQEKFLQEARLIASLDHPAIVHVQDYAVEQDTAFLVMYYAPHGTMRQRHPKGTRVALSDVLAYSKQLASALQYAHQQRIIHRDIKPENILLGSHDEVLLSDFGIALISSSSSSQSTKDAAGTALYMAPEQILGKPRPASDQYALAIVIYEWLCGSPPFQGSFPELCAQHLYAPVPSLRERNRSMPEAIERVLMTALAKEPQQRFSTVQAFIDAFEQAGKESVADATTVQASLPLNAIADDAMIVRDDTDGATVIKASSQEQSGTTMQPMSFFVTQHSGDSIVRQVEKETQPEQTGTDTIVRKELQMPVPPTLATIRLPEASSYPPYLSPAPHTPIPSVYVPQATGAMPLYPAIQDSKQGVIPAGAGKRKVFFVVATFALVLLVLFSSLAFMWEQSNAAQSKIGGTTIATATGSGSVVQSTRGVARPTQQTSPTTTKKMAALTATASALPTAAATTTPGTTPGATPTPIPTSAPTPTPTATAVPATVTASPSSVLVTNTSQYCSIDTHGGGATAMTCTITLTSNSQTTQTLNWSASMSPADYSISPTSGSIAPGKSTTFTFYNYTSVACPATETLTVQGSANTVQIPIVCTYLYVNPDTLDSSNCTHNGNWTCVVTLSTPNNSETISWQVTVEGSMAGVTFSQASGTLAPNASVQVTITIASSECPGYNDFAFTGGSLYYPGDTVGWNC